MTPTLTPMEVRPLAGLHDFVLPPELEATRPPEARGVTRDAVRMMVARRHAGTVEHSTFSEIPRFFAEGDLIVVNTSGTLAAELQGVDPNGVALQIHLSTQLPANLWTVELRRRRCAGLHGHGRATPSPWPPAAGSISSRRTHTIPKGCGCGWPPCRRRCPCSRSWPSTANRSATATSRGRWPITMYQNVYATEPGSAEMPSAGRPFTPEVLTRLAARGVGVVPIVLHTGVASLEASEPPYPEHYRVSAATAHRINDTRREGGTVVAVGTTVVRALETVVDLRGHVHAGSGWTETVITPDRVVRSVDGLLTGWHEPEASHLAMLEAVAGRPLVERSYAAALKEGYLWHEFGDVHLVLP